MRLTAVAIVVLAAACAADRDARVGDTTRAGPVRALWSHTFVDAPDGRVTAVAFSRKPRAVAVVRYLPSGQIDPAFSTVLLPEFGAGKLDALASGVDEEGRILVAACQPPDCWGYAVVGRLLPDGSRDASFGNRGVVRTSVPGAHLEPRALAVAGDGSVVVAGEAWVNRARHLFLARYRADGRPDHGFGVNGVVVDASVDPADALELEPDGSVLVAGGAFVARYGPRGERELTFGDGGVARVYELTSVRDLLVDANGRIVVAGSGPPLRRPVLAVARLRADGSIDRTFGRDGVVRDRRAGDHWARVETLVSLGDRLLAVGWATRGGAPLTRRYRIVALRVDERGRLDDGFGIDGRVTVNAFEAQARAAFLRGQEVLVVGADDDLRPTLVRFARLPVH